ncbi:ribosomal protein S19/S15 [Neurospora crassa]|uniref:Small ribosomal subunit protein uS19m n=5 Tax=Neurospora TaxID=5140 RepID=RT19_NEUCR|nr:mitochondrial 37S ribosomal protein RSM19 [Neurospora crassa OR74A]Q1K8V2.2 RecName: Full=Small ribosomal subunit protein uS19m [Neurospora crassa OR74A]6YW5_SS Chain SS, Mitochondrial ribosomal protein S19 [Neurospora crassa OR74A]6YWE_SS Chain SS, Ribosomal protein S19/S15 [Neurospora crassa]6YWX_SS Chain SS, Mitochondrial ribosomal protein S19 [Neurospora crassa OR74A]6YWY_SS Chain SS, Ribosomal protein S19/S15 [Neurospora crassa]KAK3491108.1 hypothetical protein B0T23DRAFT_383184 [Neur|eukprot:XP_963589.2 mitochondrial 37S ribosomal protein RSM19 [Neurospora crassa OR74A]
MQPTRVLFKRSVWKGPHIVPLPIQRPEPGKKIAPIRTQARSATILPNFVGLKFQVHNGKDYIDLTVTEEMVGHKLGEFSATRKPFIWGKKK